MRLETPLASRIRHPYRPIRRHPRVVFSVPITLRHLMAGRVRASHGISLDISEGGVGALVESGLQVGDTVALELNLPGRPLSAVAIVRYRTPARSGFEFLKLSVQERARLAALVGNA